MRFFGLKKPWIKGHTPHQGFTIIELLIAVFILLPFFAIGMQTFIKCVELSDTAKNSALAVAGVKNRMVAIEQTAFNQIFANYNNTTFTITGLNGMGKTYIDNSSANHVIVTISFSWKERSGRVIGEDKNINGTLDAGEDANGNGQLDSLVELTTQIYNM